MKNDAVDPWTHGYTMKVYLLEKVKAKAGPVVTIPLLYENGGLLKQNKTTKSGKKKEG